MEILNLSLLCLNKSGTCVVLVVSLYQFLRYFWAFTHFSWLNVFSLVRADLTSLHVLKVRFRLIKFIWGIMKRVHWSRTP